MDTMPLYLVPIGAMVVYEGNTWLVKDVRRHALTSDDNTAWFILAGWKEATHSDPPLINLNTLITVISSFS